jgi:hypothetical protein
MFNPKIEKIVCPYRSAEIRFSFDDQGLCGSTDIYALKQKDSKFSLKYLLTILNSKLLLFYYILEGKKKGDILEVGTESLSKIPIPNIDFINQIKFNEKAEEMIQLNNDLNDEINGFKEWLQREPYNIEKFSQKLDKYYNLSFEEFLSELKKKKVDTKARKVQELLKSEFDDSVNKINPLLQQIKETDNEIDQMVYDLYGLTPEEIKIIEDSLKKFISYHRI